MCPDCKQSESPVQVSIPTGPRVVTSATTATGPPVDGVTPFKLDSAVKLGCHQSDPELHKDSQEEVIMIPKLHKDSQEEVIMIPSRCPGHTEPDPTTPIFGGYIKTAVGSVVASCEGCGARFILHAAVTLSANTILRARDSEYTTRVL